MLLLRYRARPGVLFEREDRVYQGTAGEGVAVDADGNVYAAEGPNSLAQAGGAFTKYSVK